MRAGIYGITSFVAASILYTQSAASMPTNAPESPIQQRIRLGQPSDSMCNFDFSPVDLCDEKHVRAYAAAIKSNTVNFSDHHTIVLVEERPAYNQVSIVIVDLKEQLIYPLPVDYFSPAQGPSTLNVPNSSIRFKPGRSTLCLTGDLVAYRSIRLGEACFTFRSERFTGIDTPYTSAGKWQGH